MFEIAIWGDGKAKKKFFFQKKLKLNHEKRSKKFIMIAFKVVFQY